MDIELLSGLDRIIIYLARRIGWISMYRFYYPKQLDEPEVIDR
jgi:hypothetical protein